MTGDELIETLKTRVRNAGSQKVVAHELKVSEQFLSRVIKKRDLPGTRILTALGLEAVTTTVYREKE